ncbi:hypothetical protein [Empedobacter sp. ULE_I140]
MKGKSIFTKEEAVRLEALIKQKCEAESSQQKSIRNKIRDLGFYASDFGISGGYTVTDFKRVVKIVGDTNKSVVSNKVFKKVKVNTPINVVNKETFDFTVNLKNNVISSLKKLGYQGFVTIESVYKDLSLIPKTKGVYIIYSENINPKFEEVGTGGFFKQKNPNVSLDELNQNWVNQSNILYIGKAGSLTGSATLYSRLKQYFDFGNGKSVGHWGGRLIWQINNPYQLKVCWLPTPNNDPREIEKKLIKQFITQFGQRPFANLTN